MCVCVWSCAVSYVSLMNLLCAARCRYTSRKFWRRFVQSKHLHVLIGSSRWLPWIRVCLLHICCRAAAVVVVAVAVAVVVVVAFLAELREVINTILV